MKIFLYVSIFIISTLSSTGQIPNIKSIKGSITNTEETPLIDATVKYKKNIVRTDITGTFTIQISAFNDTLEVFHVGYKSKKLFISEKTRSPILIVLERDATELEEVIISTGYQKTPKERATGSFDFIDNKLYNEQAGTNALERLKYIANGVVPISNRLFITTSNQILIRGLSTLTLDIQKPLIILDNFEYQGDINNINPNDIENVTFLKDAAAGSIWGAKAANGVIVIVSKKGNYNHQTRIEVNSNLTVTNKPDLFYLHPISSNDLIDVEQFLFSNNYRFSDTSAIDHKPFSPVYEILFKVRRGKFTEDEANSQIAALKYRDVRNDFSKYLYSKGVNQQYALNMSGGSNNFTWILSAGTDMNIDQLSSFYNRVSLRNDNSYKISKRITINTGIYFTNGKTVSGKPGYGDISSVAFNLPSYSQLADVNGNPLPIYTKYRQDYIDTLGSGNLLDWKYYPLEDYKHSESISQSQNMNTQFGINYKVFESLTIDLKYRYQKQKIEHNTLNTLQSFFTRDLINSYSQLNRSDGTISYPIPKGDILDKTYNDITAKNLRLQLNFFKAWKSHELAAIAGSETSETLNFGNSYRTYGYNGDILTYSNVDYTNTYPLFYSSAFIPNPAVFNKSNLRLVSFYSNAAYTLQKKYSLSFSARKDASNIFGVATNDKWKPLWSSGLSWDVSKEDFYKIMVLPYLRFRITYGSQGNFDPSKAAVTTLNYLSTNPFTQTPTSQVTGFMNPDLKWEQVAMINMGVDFATKNKRISGSLEFFQKNITDLYGPYRIDPTAGVGTTITKNVGNMKGHGVDIQIKSLNINRRIKWNTDFIINYYKDKITKLAVLPDKGSSVVGSGLMRWEGYSPFGYFAYKWAGLDPNSGDPLGYLDGKVSKNWVAITGSETSMSDITYVGRLMPSLYGSFGNNINWKGLSITARITYKFGYYFKRQSINYSSLISRLNGHSDYAFRWQKPGDEIDTQIPSFLYPSNNSRENFYQNSEVLATKGDHIRLQYINCSYLLDRSKLKDLPVEAIKFYFVINNLGILWKANKNELDPDYNNLPPARSISLGLTINF